MPRFSEMHCSIARTLDVAGETWTPLIIRDVHLGLRRFDELAGDLGVSRNLLTQRLDHLIETGVLARRKYQDRPVRHVYELTEKGRDLVPVIMAMMAWGDKWATPPGGPPAHLTHTRCGHHFTPTVTCSACGEPITAGEVTTTAGPGGTTAPGTALLHTVLSP